MSKLDKTTLRTDELPRISSASNSDLVAVYSTSSNQESALTKEQLLSSIQSLDSVVYVQKSSDLSGELDSSKLYLLDGSIDMGSQSIEVPEGGLSIAGLNGARDIAVLHSSEDAYTMFTSPSGGYSGNVVMDSLTITASGAGSQVFDLDNSENLGGIDIVGVNFTNCTSLGHLTSYRQLLLNNIGYISISDGLTFNGTWAGGLAALTSIVIGFPAATLFKEGASLLFNGSVRSDLNFLSVDPTSVFMDFTESNIALDEGLVLTTFRSLSSDAMPNLPGSSVKVKYTGCEGLRDTYVGGEYTISSPVATTISSPNTLTHMAGTTLYSDLQWFSSNGDNSFLYDSDQEVEVEVVASLSFAGGSNDLLGVQIRQWDDSASAYVNIGARYTSTLNGGGGSRAENLVCIARTAINKNDRIEVWIENQSDSSNITCEAGGFVGISER